MSSVCEKRRIKRKREIRNEISELQTYIDQKTDANYHLKRSEFDPVYVQKQVDGNKEYIQKTTARISELEQQLRAVDRGELDDEIMKSYEDAKAILNAKRENLRKIKQKNKEQKQDNIIKSKTYRKNIIADHRADKNMKRQIRSGWIYYNRVCDSIPEYITKKLKKLPNNKGYLWRGVSLYGDLPEKRGPTVLFENKKGYTIIHEYTHSYYSVYEQKRGQKRVLVSRTPKRRPR